MPSNKKKRPFVSAEESVVLEKKRRLEQRLRLLRLHLRQKEIEESSLQFPALSERTPTSTTRSNRKVQRPQKYDEVQVGSVKLSGNMSKCRQLLQTVMNHKLAWIFSEPVDPVKLNIPTYLDVIETPMDLGTIKNNLLMGLYAGVDQFAADVRLVWNNAIRFNGKGSDVAKMAEEMSEYFEERFKKLVNAPFEKKSSVKKKKKQPKKQVVREHHVDSNDVGGELAKLKREMDLMRRRINEKIKGSSKKSTSKAPSKNQPLSYKEKQTLRQDIINLDQEKLDAVVEIITRRMPHLCQGDDDDMEIDIDQLDIPTLRELQQHVRRTKQSNTNKNSKKKTPRRTPTTGTGKVRSPARLSRVHSAPTPAVRARAASAAGNRSDSSSESESSDSDSDDSSSDSASMIVGRQAAKQPRQRQTTAAKKKPKAAYGDPSQFESKGHSSSNMQRQANEGEEGGEEAAQEREDAVAMNSDAWSNFGTAGSETKQMGDKNGGKDSLWSDFQQKSQEMKQKRLEEERLAKEAARARELEFERREREKEEEKRLARERREEEERMLKKQAEEEQRQRERDIQARREEARRRREESLNAVDIEEQRAGIGGFPSHGSMADFLG
eukprot:CAMPEP_0197524370 /NCGR_PEP_ID=MMETSP1318-20131121/9069_1 /TAXON_ID=552666 /ORGANISM="Partenskyella glossopodia, Strain RCC365" /LENGTH=608 /DNA_ID=CAMNT_0043077311 /DNA_START=86 /DNA_END=1915 /DNA_ORIENTATION=+